MTEKIQGTKKSKMEEIDTPNQKEELNDNNSEAPELVTTNTGEEAKSSGEDTLTSDIQDSEIETIGTIKTEEPTTESLTYMGIDSTALIDIVFVEADDDLDENDKIVTNWIDDIDKANEDKSLDKGVAIQNGVALAEVLVAEANRSINMAAKYYADRAIAIGNICHKLKELTRNLDIPWEVWADENLPFLAERNRQKFMKLAKRTDCYPHTYLGVDRLDTLCSVTKHFEGEDKIGDFLNKYSIPFDMESEQNMTEFKNSVDVGIANERLLKKGIQLDPNLVTNAVNAKVKIDTALIKRLRDIQNCEGNPETLLTNLTINQGDDDPEKSSQKQIQDFNSLSTKLVKTINYIIRDTDQLDELDKDTFVDLYKILEKLREVSNIDIDEKTEA